MCGLAFTGATLTLPQYLEIMQEMAIMQHVEMALVTPCSLQPITSVFNTKLPWREDFHNMKKLIFFSPQDKIVDWFYYQE